MPCVEPIGALNPRDCPFEDYGRIGTGQRTGSQRLDTRFIKSELSHAARKAAVLAVIFAVLAAPVVLMLTHDFTPQDISETVEPVEDAEADGHDHDAPEGEHRSGSHGSHGPADHDHQFHALIGPPAGAVKPLSNAAGSAIRDRFRHLTPEGPRRPPRLT